VTLALLLNNKSPPRQNPRKKKQPLAEQERRSTEEQERRRQKQKNEKEEEVERRTKKKNKKLAQERSPKQAQERSTTQKPNHCLRRKTLSSGKENAHLYTSSTARKLTPASAFPDTENSKNPHSRTASLLCTFRSPGPNSKIPLPVLKINYRPHSTFPAKDRVSKHPHI
jgi:hypothetical protein